MKHKNLKTTMNYRKTDYMNNNKINNNSNSNKERTTSMSKRQRNS